MSIRIDCKDKEILNIKNSIFGYLHKTIKDSIEEQHLNVGEKIDRFMYDTDQDIHGTGAVTASVSDYSFKKEDVLALANLLKKSINANFEYFNRFENCIIHLNNFHQELLKYAEELE